MDIISNLPDEILDLILEKLPLMDKVRTSVLSKIWRLRWTSCPSLMVDEQFHDDLDIAEGIRIDELDDESASYAIARLEPARIVESVVSQHRGCIREFSLFIPSCYEMGTPGLSIYQAAISFVAIGSSSSLETLILDGRRMGEAGLFLPPSIFSLENLRHLETRCFQFQPPSFFEGFSNLTFFSLESQTSSLETVSQFVSVCPQLETIVLKYLLFRDQNIDLKAPQLRHLHLYGLFNDIFVSNAQNLNSITLISFRGAKGISAYTYRFLSSTTQLEHFSLNGMFCEILGRCGVTHMLPKYTLMKRLEFYVMNLDQADQLQCVLSLLAASPNLRELKLTLNEVTGEALEQYEWLIQKYIDANFEHLLRVELCGIDGTKTQMKIIELLLCLSPVLEMMHITFNPYLNSMEELRLQEFIETYHRASAKAKLQIVSGGWRSGREMGFCV